MKETTIIEKENIAALGKKLKNPVLLIGLPGIGLIGQVAAKYIAKEMRTKEVATLYSPYFPHQVLMSKKGTMRLIHHKFYVFDGKKTDLVILVGDVQPMSSQGQYEVAGKIIDFAKKIGIKRIVTIGGYSTGAISEKRRIFGVVTNKATIDELKKFDVVFGEARGSIVGSAGIIPALARLRGIEGICLLGETHGGYIDTSAAREVVRLLSRYLDFEVSLKGIDERAKKSEKMIKGLEEEIRRNMDAATGHSSKNVSYIR
jgi:uncharacterized protein (TIGR00162 family)